MVVHKSLFFDHQLSDGGLYKSLGFVLEEEIKPDYHYALQKQRLHKSEFTIECFKNDPSLKFEENIRRSN